jgi:hypothetical protein
VNVTGDGAVGPESCREDEAYFALLKDVGGAVALSGLRAGVSDQRHAESGAVEIGRLARVADVELDVICALEGEKVSGLNLLVLNGCVRCHGEVSGHVVPGMRI